MILSAFKVTTQLICLFLVLCLISFFFDAFNTIPLQVLSLANGLKLEMLC